MKVNKGSPNIINLCFHPIVCRFLDGNFYKWEAAHKFDTARVEFKKISTEGNKFRLEAVEVNLPPESDNIEYIVSRECLRATKKLHPNRKDLMAPGDQSPDVNQAVKYCIGWLQAID